MSEKENRHSVKSAIQSKPEASPPVDLSCITHERTEYAGCGSVSTAWVSNYGDIGKTQSVPPDGFICVIRFRTNLSSGGSVRAVRGNKTIGRPPDNCSYPGRGIGRGPVRSSEPSRRPRHRSSQVRLV